MHMKGEKGVCSERVTIIRDEHIDNDRWFISQLVDQRLSHRQIVKNRNRPKEQGHNVA